MRKQLSPVFEILLLKLGIFERTEVRRRLVTLAVHLYDIGIAVRHDKRNKNDRQYDQYKHNYRGDCERIFHELSHTVPEKCRGFAHYVRLTFLLFRGGLKFAQVYLQAEWCLFWCIHVFPSYPSLILGSTIL